MLLKLFARQHLESATETNDLYGSKFTTMSSTIVYIVHVEDTINLYGIFNYVIRIC